jgi:hypothetical protein
MYVYSDYTRLIILIALGIIVYIIYRRGQERRDEEKHQQEQDR